MIINEAHHHTEDQNYQKNIDQVDLLAQKVKVLENIREHELVENSFCYFR